jgi:hypothetical protein
MRINCLTTLSNLLHELLEAPIKKTSAYALFWLAFGREIVHKISIK